MLGVNLLIAALTYLVLTVLLFGDLLKPVAFATFWSGLLGLDHWRRLAIIGVAASLLVFLRPFRKAIPGALLPSAFVILAVLVPTALVGFYADVLRHRAVLMFGADEVDERSFFSSIKNAPEEFQFFLHTAVLKNCKPYAWSYKTQSFYEVPSSAAVNVLPRPWIKKCATQIERS